MTDTDIVHLFGTALVLACKLALPSLAVCLVVGVAVSLGQALFSVQDQSPAFLAKLVGVGVVLVATGSWMLRSAVDFFHQTTALIPHLLT
jgi:flagellar biosynthetic protein FliQ